VRGRPKGTIKIVDVKSDMPTVDQALHRLEREIANGKAYKIRLLKVIHGYGSSGVGGEIRIAVQKRLRELAETGEIQGCIFGEDWSKSNEVSWRLLREHPELKNDPHLGRRNLGITIVIL